MGDTVRSEVADVQRLPIREFLDGGYLQEVNRRILHPCGLALEVQVAQDPTAVVLLTRGGVEALRQLIEYVRSENVEWADQMDELERRLDDADLLEPGDARVASVWDCRADEEGVVFAADVLDAAKARKVSREMTYRGLTRQAKLGFIVQPVPDLDEATPIG